MSDWNNDFNGISICYDDRVVRIKTDRYLLDFLGRPGNGALELSAYILNEYRVQKNKPLEISRHSLAIEILAHAYLDQISEVLLELGQTGGGTMKKAQDALRKIRRHTDIIDCGELDADGDRHVWDSLVPYHMMIYMACGRKA